MDDLLRSQIKDSCRLALPEGLKDLMSDISREVLRAQPQNLYQFIADYLSVLLVTREHLFIAARVCDDVCKNRCCEELENELRELSLNDEDVEKCLDIIAKYFSNGQVKEGNLLQKLLRETSIKQNDLPAIQDAVRRAFLRHRLNTAASVELSSTHGDLDETELAAKHTLNIYKKATEHPDINYDCVATKIQAAYRSYNVRRERRSGGHKESNTCERKKEDTTEKVHFQVKGEKGENTDHTAQLVADFIHKKRCASKCSSMSLAGSYISLPLYKPYSIGQPSDIVEADEVGEREKERANFDYVTNQLNDEHRNQRHSPEIKEKKAISFHNLLEVVEPVEDENYLSDEADEAGYESDEVDEEMIHEDISNKENADGNYSLKDLRSSFSEQATKETTVIMESKGDTESSLSEGYDEVQQNEMTRITQNCNDDVQVMKNDMEEEYNIVSADDGEFEQHTNYEGKINVRENDGDDDDDFDNDEVSVGSIKSI